MHPRTLLRSLALAAVLLAGSRAAAAQQPAPGPCADSLYQVLRARPLQDLSEREYEYFVQREKTCTEYQTLSGLVNAPAAPRAASPVRLPTETYTQGNPSGGADVFVRNLSDRPVIVNSVRVYECVGLRATSCGMHYPKVKLRPGQSRRVLTIRYQSADVRAGYRYQYNTSAADS